MKKIWKSLPFRLILGVVIGIILGQAANETFMNVIVSLRYILSQVINFCVPLIIIGFIAPSITKLGSSASRMRRSSSGKTKGMGRPNRSASSTP